MVVSSWRKLNHLVPSPDCTTKNNQIIEWRDARQQPTQAQIDAVLDQNVIDSENNLSEESKFNQDVIKAVGLTMKDFMNEIIAGRIDAITNSELKAKFKSYL